MQESSEYPKESQNINNDRNNSNYKNNHNIKNNTNKHLIMALIKIRIL